MGHCRSERYSMVHPQAKLRGIIHSLTLSPPLRVRELKEKKLRDLETLSDLSCIKQKSMRDTCSGLLGCDKFQSGAIISLK